MARAHWPKKDVGVLKRHPLGGAVGFKNFKLYMTNTPKCIHSSLARGVPISPSCICSRMNDV